MEWKHTSDDDVKRQVFNADEILLIMKGITSEDAELLGFGVDNNKPEWLICTVFPVPPPAVRPSVRNDTGQRCEDDLTHKLCDIVKTNNMLKQKTDKNASKEQLDYWGRARQLRMNPHYRIQDCNEKRVVDIQGYKEHSCNYLTIEKR
eukprot:343855-Prorocentrum_minimum.AAC.1